MKVYSVTARAKFYVLADSDQDALKLAAELAPMDDIPVEAEPDWQAYCIPAQTPYHRRLCVNSEPETGAEHEE